MIITFLIKIPIKKLQKQHERLLNEAFAFFTVNKLAAYNRIKEAEKIAAKIQHLKKYIINS